jgi:hypothetical protein
VALIEAAVIGSLNVALTVVAAPTLVAPAAGVMLVTVGGVVSAGGGGPDEVTRLTALPVATDVPPAGFWLMIDPEGTVVLEAVVSVPTVRFADVIALFAFAFVIPTTLGTVTGGGGVGGTPSTTSALISFIFCTPSQPLRP